MGCATSMPADDSPAVSLCRDRCAFLDDAIRQRFALAEAHAAYLHSLSSVGVSLDRFFASPVLNLPAQRKEPPGSPTQHHLHSRSNSGSGSHLHFHSDSDDGSLLHHDPISTVHQQSYGGGGFMNVSYMKKETTPSVVHAQRPVSPEIASSSSYSRNYHNYADSSNSNSNNNKNDHNYSHNYNSNGYPGYQDHGGGGRFFDDSKPPPPPPVPPKSSTWEFLNPFEASETYYLVYNLSHDSREVRENERIPDLGDDDDEGVMEVLGHQKFVGSERSSYGKAALSEEMAAKDEDLRRTVNKNVNVNVEGIRPKDRGKDDGFKARGEIKGDLGAVKEIQVQFQRASESGNEVAKLLEVGKLQYKRKHAVSSKILHLPVVSWQSSSSKSSDQDIAAFLDVQDMELMSKNLSSTLHKLYLWEKKLYEEVKVEEKMRVLHEQKSRKMKYMDEKGSEVQKVDATRSLVRSLSTKIKIAIQVVDKISLKISSLRDEELWPQLNEFIQGSTRMWKSMLECHQNQCQAIREVTQLDAIAFHRHFSDANFEATHQLQHDLVNWIMCFSYWAGAQKGFIRALNNWLMKCLLYVPEETVDGIIPFSPGRIGAPQVFAICNQWSQSLDAISEKQVANSMRDFASNVLQLWDRDKGEMRQQMLANKDERKIKSLEKDEQKIQKEIQALDKRMAGVNNGTGMALSSGHVVYPSETARGGSFQVSLQHVLEAMGKFAANSLKVYEELGKRFEEDHLDLEHGEGS